MVEFFLGVLLIGTTVIAHGMFTVTLVTAIRSREQQLFTHPGILRRSLVVAGSACLLTVKHAVDILLWALALWIVAHPQLCDFQNAVYFSSITYTTLGYGDITLTGSARLLCGFEAINGLILFGISTATLFALVDHLWLREPRVDRP